MLLLDDIVGPANGLLVRVLRSPVHRVASGGLMVVRWQGRRSGSWYEAPVGYQLVDGRVVVLISKPAAKTWWRNFTEPWPAELTIRRTRRPASGSVVEPGTPEFFEHVERTLRRLPWLGSQFGGIRYDRDTGLTDDQREVLAEHVAAVVFELDGA